MLSEPHPGQRRFSNIGYSHCFTYFWLIFLHPVLYRTTELCSHWSDEDAEGIGVFDSTLPGKVTNYVISVRFDEAGEIEDIAMES
jgi:hypothetical protein